MILRQWQKKSIYVVASALLLIIVFTLRKPRNIYFETKCVWKKSELFFFCFLATRKQICVCNIGVRERKNRNICVCNNLSVTLCLRLPPAIMVTLWGLKRRRTQSFEHLV